MAPAITYAQAYALYQGESQLAALLSGYQADGVTPVGTVQRVTAGFMAPGQSAKQYAGKVATSTTVPVTVTLETVTAGKTFYITDILISSDSASGSTTTVDTRIQAAGTDIFRSGVHNLAPIDMTGIETPPFGTTGQSVTILLPVTALGAVNIWYNIFGYEQ